MAGRSTRYWLYMGVLIAAGLVLFIFESLIPRPLPWFKPGLANLLTVLALYRFDGRSALTVTIGRVVLAAFILGTFFSPAFWLSFTAGCSAALVMSLLYRRGAGAFSPIGISLAGAVVHNLAQLAMAWLLIVKDSHIFLMLPLLLLPALFTGPLIGFVAILILRRWPQV
jgi:heptaprenyl diphosphate synthase